MSNKEFIVKFAIILFAITFICSLLLVLCNELTHERIANLQKETENAARVEVLPEAESFAEIDVDTVAEAYRAEDKNGNLVGYCFKAEPSGFGGSISMMVGIDNNLRVTGVKITNMSETPGLGAKAGDKSWIEQFSGKSDSVTVVKTGNAKDNEINAISGATITSKAVAEGVNNSLSAAKVLFEKEGK